MFGRKKRLKFLEENKVCPENQPYLGLGALLIEMNDSTSLVLKMRVKQSIFVSIIRDDWGISDKESALKMIEWLLASGHRAEYQEAFLAFQAGNTKAIPAANEDSFADLVEIQASTYKYTADDFKCCSTIAAWDFERAAFLVRSCCHLGFFTEEEAWKMLKEQIAPLVKQIDFGDWRTYSISCIAGRSFCYGGDASDVLFPANDLLNNKKETTVWQQWPLSAL
ncbi:DUF1266 domain-containing protein [Listeria ilorinensis]|uniref:DUF1266 domain-containing protein n=1 Tax=Listeria ilorinensis TaxID=2867439 RepID=UPI001EF572C0|nr:DUF1266 domain-containing protein [Listeria ilorinensis]